MDVEVIIILLMRAKRLLHALKRNVRIEYPVPSALYLINRCSNFNAISEQVLYRINHSTTRTNQLNLSNIRNEMTIPLNTLITAFDDWITYQYNQELVSEEKEHTLSKATIEFDRIYGILNRFAQEINIVLII
jgi:hypothetical protein